MARKTVRQIADLLEKIDTAMLTTVGPDGFLVSRPLSTRASSFDGKRVWFFTEADSPKVAEIARHPKVNLAYASSDRNTYVSLAGTAEVNRDRRRIGRLWNDAMKAFFPNGKDDPNLVLLEVQVRSIEYWDGPGSLVGKLVGFVVARVTGDEEHMGDNRLIDMSGKRAASRLPPSHKDAPAGARKAAKQALKKTPTKKTPTKKAAAGKASAKKTASSKAPAKTSTRTAATKKPVAGKATAKRPATKKAATKKAAAGKTSGRATNGPAAKAPVKRATKKSARRSTSTAGARAEAIRRVRTRGR